MDDMSRTKSPLKTAYDRFMKSEGIPIVEGWYVADVRETERRPWKRLGGKGAFIQLYGLEDITALYVVEIPPGEALKTERHMYEEIYYILAGSGSTEVVAPDGTAQRFGWRKGDLFGIPLNVPHRLVNDGREPALALRLMLRLSWTSSTTLSSSSSAISGLPIDTMDRPITSR